MKKLYGFAGAVLLLGMAALYGCGGNGSDTGKLTLKLSDAPVDGATHVWIKFDAIEIKPAEGERLTYDLAGTQRIDLLTLTNGETATLLDGIELPAGQYNWIRLMVNTAPEDLSGGPFSEENFCYIVIGEDAFPLVIPSGDQSGLKLNRPFVVPAGGSANFVLDFDLRKSVHTAESGDKYILRPTIRIEDLSKVGTIAGEITNLGANACADATVYVFSGSGIVPDDVDFIDPEPIASAKAVETEGVCGYTVPFLSEGPYTVALTFDAALDDPATDDAGVVFDLAADASVVEDSVTTVNLALPL